MKPLHWAIILLAIVLPFSIICRNLVNTRFSVLKDEVRINNAIDTATKDAIDQIIAVSSFDYDDQFGDVIDITPSLAQESIDTFFHTLATNYNIPYQQKDKNPSTSYIKTYFSPYIPVVLVIAYDGFYVYSQEPSTDGTFGYQLSTKIPYVVDEEEYTIGYTLKNDIYLYLNSTNKCYTGRIKYNTLNEIKDEYDKNYSSLDVDTIASLTDDMSIIIYALTKNGMLKDSAGLERLQPTDSTTNFISNEVLNADGSISMGKFQELRKKTIVNIVSDVLTEEINEHNEYANITGISYRFSLPEISEAEWINSINDICIMSFVQGIQLGTADGIFFNSYALGGSQIVNKGYLYGDTERSNGIKLYHSKENCPSVNGEITGIFLDWEDAYREGYYPCQTCN